MKLGRAAEPRNAKPPRAFKRLSGAAEGGSVPGHRLAVRALRLAELQPFLSRPDRVAAASGGSELDHASSLLARAAVNLAAGSGAGLPPGGTGTGTAAIVGLSLP